MFHSVSWVLKAVFQTFAIDNWSVRLAESQSVLCAMFFYFLFTRKWVFLPQNRVLSEDLGVKSKDLGVKSKDFGVKSKDFGVKSKDLEVKSKDLGALSKDFAVFLPLIRVVLSENEEICLKTGCLVVLSSRFF
ncbi:hypothetical protein AGMMS50293_13710 [Spirochaetia bacterium]|nr:hypothetical protein AGMMS50293_13710 [Spirochaetia bacterium]